MCSTWLKPYSATYVVGNSCSNNSLTFSQTSAKCSLHLIQKYDHLCNNKKSRASSLFGSRWKVPGYEIAFSYVTMWNHICYVHGKKALLPVAFYTIQLSAWSPQQKDFLVSLKLWWLNVTHWSKLSLPKPTVLVYSIIGQMNTIQLYPQSQQNTRTDWKTQ